MMEFQTVNICSLTIISKLLSMFIFIYITVISVQMIQLEKENV